jgi:hypothetical protein
MAIETRVTTEPRPEQVADPQPVPQPVPEVIVYGHSWLLYWWPLWAVGYLIALIIWLQPVPAAVRGSEELFAANKNLDVIYTILLVLLIVINSSSARGWVSALVVAILAFIVLLFAHLDWWGTILHWLGHQTISLNLGFYLFSSTVLFVIWCLTIFGFDHLSFWRIRPGQITHEYVLGAVDQTYDTETMLFTKQQNDIFRHWILGLGSGDLRMATMGGTGVQASVQNVASVRSKMTRIDQMVATREVTGTP